MLDPIQFASCESNFQAGFTNVLTRPYGKLFYNKENRLSHDSNHAVILKPQADLDIAFKDIITFYESLGIKPRIYPSYQNGETKILKAYFQKYGFIYQSYASSFLYFKNYISAGIPGKLTFKRLPKVTAGIREIILSENAGDWTVKVLERHIQSEAFHLLAGYESSKPVAMASVNIMNGFSRVDDVITHKEYRNRGYARGLIHYLVDYHFKLTNNPLYLYSGNLIALKIYRETGFVDFPFSVFSWSAWKN